MSNSAEYSYHNEGGSMNVFNQGGPGPQQMSNKQMNQMQQRGNMQ